jgi:hypothetical protein
MVDMPISTTINSPATLHALMTTTDAADLAQSYTQTADIDMLDLTSQSIGSDNEFTGNYDGGYYNITIRNVVPTYTGLFDTISGNGTSILIQNVNVIYNNPISITNVILWGGISSLLQHGTITNCSVTTNAAISITLLPDNACGIFCGEILINSTITNSQLIINNAITINGADGSSIGLFCGYIEASIIDCSITASDGSYGISLTGSLTGGDQSYIGIFCGQIGDKTETLGAYGSLSNITVNLNNSSILLDGTGTIYKGAICGGIVGIDRNTSNAINCSININNNQTLTGSFNDFFGDIGNFTNIQNCQFRYTTTTNNTSRPLTITNPASLPVAPVIYINNYSNTYQLTSGSYYIPNPSASLSIGSQTVLLQSQPSPTGLLINGTLYSVGTSFSFSTSGYRHTIRVNGVGSMYFGLDTDAIPPTTNVSSSIECICQIDSCATNPQTGVTEDSRITNIRQDKTIRVNVDRQFAVNSIIAPKFNSYSDYMKYLQGALRR